MIPIEKDARETSHRSSMTSWQRKELIRVLSMDMYGYTMTDLACLTDPELHLQWLAECRYVSVNKAPLLIKDNENTLED